MRLPHTRTASPDTVSHQPYVGVHSDYRGLGFGRRLFERFFGVVEGIPVRLHFSGEGVHGVVFCRRIIPDAWPRSPQSESEAASSDPVAAAPPAIVIVDKTRLMAPTLTDCA